MLSTTLGTAKNENYKENSKLNENIASIMMITKLYDPKNHFKTNRKSTERINVMSVYNTKCRTLKISYSKL